MSIKTSATSVYSMSIFLLLLLVGPQGGFGKNLQSLKDRPHTMHRLNATKVATVRNTKQVYLHRPYRSEYQVIDEDADLDRDLKDGHGRRLETTTLYGLDIRTTFGFDFTELEYILAKEYDDDTYQDITITVNPTFFEVEELIRLTEIYYKRIMAQRFSPWYFSLSEIKELSSAIISDTVFILDLELVLTFRHVEDAPDPYGVVPTHVQVRDGIESEIFGAVDIYLTEFVNTIEEVPYGDFEYANQVIIEIGLGITDSPSAAPSSLADLVPTVSPAPTAAPTNPPTRTPTTPVPTPRPTFTPTIQPTTSPPTRFPTVSPTARPTTSPPTARPTTSPPTRFPTVSPTGRPTRTPVTIFSTAPINIRYNFKGTEGEPWDENVNNSVQIAIDAAADFFNRPASVPAFPYDGFFIENSCETAAVPPTNIVNNPPEIQFVAQVVCKFEGVAAPDQAAFQQFLTGDAENARETYVQLLQDKSDPNLNRVTQVSVEVGAALVQDPRVT